MASLPVGDWRVAAHAGVRHAVMTVDKAWILYAAAKVKNNQPVIFR